MLTCYAQLFTLALFYFATASDAFYLPSAFVPATIGGQSVMSHGMPSSTSIRSSTRRFAKDADMTPEEREIAVEKATKAMTAFSNQYITKTATKYCSDLTVPAVVIKGLAEHKVSLGAPLCPCRYYEDKEREAKDGFWNCPCVPMRERHECHCMLFLTEDNGFVGEETNISVEEVVDMSSKAMGG